MPASNQAHGQASTGEIFSKFSRKPGLNNQSEKDDILPKAEQYNPRNSTTQFTCLVGLVHQGNIDVWNAFLLSTSAGAAKMGHQQPST